MTENVNPKQLHVAVNDSESQAPPDQASVTQPLPPQSQYCKPGMLGMPREMSQPSALQLPPLQNLTIEPNHGGAGGSNPPQIGPNMSQLQLQQQGPGTMQPRTQKNSVMGFPTGINTGIMTQGNQQPVDPGDTMGIQPAPGTKNLNQQMMQNKYRVANPNLLQQQQVNQFGQIQQPAPPYQYPRQPHPGQGEMIRPEMVRPSCLMGQQMHHR